eukprot:10362702-Alexandrium_andersonii.AAC.1
MLSLRQVECSVSGGLRPLNSRPVHISLEYNAGASIPEEEPRLRFWPLRSLSSGPLASHVPPARARALH